MDQISEHINYPNHKIHSNDKMSKMFVNLGSNRYKTQQQLYMPTQLSTYFLLMSIFDTPKTIYQILIGNQTWEKHVTLY